ncbi:hypothetical protein TL5118_00731 [Thalassovita autumnalis]|uniref:Type IV pilus biogenesis n=1 Tax=Thalassovita autumnalis TaxID=2072972 RepID=A0A0N7LUP1_9RHOB|nr:hypothetical protein [Thalassovita autumnalis]CUH64042.1 hypothetical protein TL5118_00731 [Thalassovita autumnalis]CUH72802.1 hypothetical protein TL5120_02599 [Thalassovita autumnalis]
MSVRGRLERSLTIDAAATERSALPMGHASLLGTILTPEGPRAYVHLGAGRIHKVRPGDILEGAEVTAIHSGALTLTRGDDQRQMRLPATT